MLRSTPFCAVESADFLIWDRDHKFLPAESFQIVHPLDARRSRPGMSVRRRRTTASLGPVSVLAWFAAKVPEGAHASRHTCVDHVSTARMLLHAAKHDCNLRPLPYAALNVSQATRSLRTRQTHDGRRAACL
jgi:hypothetical protein